MWGAGGVGLAGWHCCPLPPSARGSCSACTGLGSDGTEQRTLRGHAVRSQPSVICEFTDAGLRDRRPRASLPGCVWPPSLCVLHLWSHHTLRASNPECFSLALACRLCLSLGRSPRTSSALTALPSLHAGQRPTCSCLFDGVSFLQNIHSRDFPRGHQGGAPPTLLGTEVGERPCLGFGSG